MYARRSFWCIITTMRAAGFKVKPYHAFVPSFGEWGFALLSHEELPEDCQLPSGLKFLNQKTLPGLFEFPADMQPMKTDVNRLFDQALVRYYQADWARVND